MTKPFDPIALKIGRAYKGGRAQLIEAGKLLAGVKAVTPHGQWEAWIEANADALGFRDPSTASRLMKLAANPASTQDLWEGNCTEAITLTPSSTDTGWFQDVLKHASAICFPQGRVKFHAPETGKKGTPALGSAFAHFGPKHKKFAATFREIGVVAKILSDCER